MSKYFSIFKTSFKQEKKTLTNSIIAVISFAVIIFIFKQLWEFIYGGSGVGQVINGYTLNMMIWYMIVAEILMYAQNARTVTKAFGNDIKSGRIAYQLNKPYNYYGYQVANQIGAFIWKLCFLLPAGLFMGLILLGPIENFHISYILPVILCIIIGCLLTSMLYGVVGLLSFWIEESTPFTWIIQKFLMLFGLFFPPEFFPNSIQKIIQYSPVFAIVSGPSKLLANFSWELFSEVIISQAIYFVICLILGITLFKFGTRKVNINGG